MQITLVPQWPQNISTHWMSWQHITTHPTCKDSMPKYQCDTFPCKLNQYGPVKHWSTLPESDMSHDFKTVYLVWNIGCLNFWNIEYSPAKYFWQNFIHYLFGWSYGPKYWHFSFIWNQFLLPKYSPWVTNVIPCMAITFKLFLKNALAARQRMCTWSSSPTLAGKMLKPMWTAQSSGTRME